jgi:hypothetical protein
MPVATQEIPERRFSTEAYALTFLDDPPFVYLDDRAGHQLAKLFALSSVHPLHGRDDTTAIEPWQVEERAGETIFSRPASSSVWQRKTYRFRCRPERFLYEIEVEGSGRLAEVQYFGGYCSARPRWGSGFFLSGQQFRQGFNPEPNAAGVTHFDPRGGALIDLTGAPLPGKAHWFFTPPPFCFAFDTGAGWIGMGVEAAAGGWGFTEYRYHGQSGFWLSLSYEGYTAVDGQYVLPAIGIDFAGSEWEVLGAHVAALREADLVEGRNKQEADWWRKPIFCGWGAQCARAAREHGYVVIPGQKPDVAAFLATMKYAAGYARQEVYEGFLTALAQHGLRPGTIVIDDKWQATYGENRADESKWPDLRGFIKERHAAGQRVLLWLKAWDREGVPDAECIANAAGRPLTTDPTNPAYQRRLRATVHQLLSPDGYDADGFKIDFTHRIPNGPGMTLHGNQWGLELMKRYLATVYTAAKEAKPDALIVTHTPHPYLAPVLDMIRLNDMLDLSGHHAPDVARNVDHVLGSRARVARIACPNTPIDTDNWPVLDRAHWREYLRRQPAIGVPSLYFATEIDLSQERLVEDDYQLIREVWQCSPAR